MDRRRGRRGGARRPGSLLGSEGGLPLRPPARRRRRAARPHRPRPLPLAGGRRPRPRPPPGPPLRTRWPARTWTPFPAATGWPRGSRRCSRPARWAPRPGARAGRSGCGGHRVRSTPSCSPATRTAASACCSTRSRWTRPAPPPSTRGLPPRRAPGWPTSSRPAATRSRCCTCSTSPPARRSTDRSTAAATPPWPGSPAGRRSSTSGGSRPTRCPPARSSSTAGCGGTSSGPTRRRTSSVWGAGLDPTSYFGCSVSRDGRWLVVTASAGTAPRDDVWLFDLVAGGPPAEVQVGVDARCSAHVERDGRLWVTDRPGRPARPAVRRRPGHPAAVGRPCSPRTPRRCSRTGSLLDDGVLAVLRSRHALSEITLHDGGSRHAGRAPRPGHRRRPQRRADRRHPDLAVLDDRDRARAGAGPRRDHRRRRGLGRVPRPRRARRGGRHPDRVDVLRRHDRARPGAVAARRPGPAAADRALRLRRLRRRPVAGLHGERAGLGRGGRRVGGGEPAGRHRGGRGLAPRRHARGQAERLRRLRLLRRRPRRAGLDDAGAARRLRRQQRRPAGRGGAHAATVGVRRRWSAARPCSTWSATSSSGSAAPGTTSTAPPPTRRSWAGCCPTRRTTASSTGPTTPRCCSPSSTATAGSTPCTAASSARRCSGPPPRTRRCCCAPSRDVGHGARAVSRTVGLSVDTLSFLARHTGLEL